MNDRESIAPRLRAACFCRPREMTRLRRLLHEAADEIERAHGERDSAYLCIVEGTRAFAPPLEPADVRKWFDDHEQTIRAVASWKGGRAQAILDAAVRKAVKSSAENLRAEVAARRVRKALDLLGADPHDDPHAIAEAREQLEEARAILAEGRHAE